MSIDAARVWVHVLLLCMQTVDVPDEPAIVDYHADASAIFIKLVTIEHLLPDAHNGSRDMELIDRVRVMSDVCCFLDDMCEEFGIERIKTICASSRAVHAQISNIEFLMLELIFYLLSAFAYLAVAGMYRVSNQHCMDALDYALAARNVILQYAAQVCAWFICVPSSRRFLFSNAFRAYAA